MTETPPARVLVVGAGLAGSLLACTLARRGHHVLVCERRGDPRVGGFAGGRSINLALSARGIDALARVGLDRAVLDEGIPMRGRRMHAVDGSLSYHPYSSNPDEAINSVGRGNVNLRLLEAADAHDHVEMRFDRRCVDVDLDAPAATFETADGSTERVEADVVIGADGAYSVVRSFMQRTERFDYSQTYLAHGYKELTIPPAPGGSFALDQHALHIWPRGGSMMIALPNLDRTFTVTLFWPMEGPIGFETIRGDERVRSFFEQRYPDALELMPDLVREYAVNPVGSLVTIRCAPWHRGGRTLVIGDAAHAIVPFYGQGMNAAFEDCALLDRALDEHGDRWTDTIEAFSSSRKPDADAIGDLAMDNFIEMRDKVGSKRFLAWKWLEHRLHRLLPSWYLPLYNMVSFSTIPYAEARRRARRQERIVVAGLAAMAVLLVLVHVAALRAVLGG